MFKVAFVVTLAILFWAQLASSTIVEVPLPELTGRYFTDEVYQRNCTFVLSAPPTVVHSAALRLIGTSTIRLAYCDNDMFTFSIPVQFLGRMLDETTGGEWDANTIRSEDGAFNVTVPFVPFAQASWAFLQQNGTAQINLLGYGTPDIDSCWPLTLWSEAFVEQAVLIIDAEFPIPIEQSTWGRVKALFGRSE
jgi:hypothetical protein